MKKIFMTMLVLAGAVLGVQAQEQKGTYREVSPAYDEFNPHWYLQVQGGAQETVGEAKFGDLISPNVQVALGYQFSKVVGLRLAVNGWQSKGGFNENINETYKFKYVAPGLDVTFNLSNLLCGWNPKRTLNVSAFLGGAANICFDNDEANDLAYKDRGKNVPTFRFEHLYDGTQILPVGRAGLIFDIRLSDVVSLLVEGNANVLNDHYNSKHADNPDWYFNALAGLKLNLGKTYIHHDAVTEFIPAPKKKVKKTVEDVKYVDIQPLAENVYFVINRTELRDSEIPALSNVVAYLNKYPKATVSITGYADKDTGTTVINDRLSVGRASVVKAYLMEQGIAEERIFSDAKGDTVQPYETPEENRVTVCLAEANEKEKVVTTREIEVEVDE